MKLISDVDIDKEYELSNYLGKIKLGKIKFVNKELCYFSYNRGVYCKEKFSDEHWAPLIEEYCQNDNKTIMGLKHNILYLRVLCRISFENNAKFKLVPD